MQARYFPADVPLPDDPPDDPLVAEPQAVRPTSALAATAAVINFFNSYLPLMKGSASLRSSPTGDVARPTGREHERGPCPDSPQASPGDSATEGTSASSPVLMPN